VAARVSGRRNRDEIVGERDGVVARQPPLDLSRARRDVVRMEDPLAGEALPKGGVVRDVVPVGQEERPDAATGPERRE
jgi:hypothetical protein